MSQSKYFWLNTAIYRNASVTNWQWVWVSSITSSMQTFAFNNWYNGTFDFNGDSVYLSTRDYKFYVGNGGQLYYNSSFENIGILCEAPVNPMSNNQINILLLSKTAAFTAQR